MPASHSKIAIKTSIVLDQFTGSSALAKNVVAPIIVLTLVPWSAQQQLNSELGKL
jgi:hypothetical protein